MLPLKVYASSLPSSTPEVASLVTSASAVTKKPGSLILPGHRSFSNGRGSGSGDGFPPFLPKEVEKSKTLLPETWLRELRGSMFSSCLEWRCAYPLLEEAGLEAWAIDVLGSGFSDLERLPPCNPEAKRHHLYQFWKSYIRRSMILVGPSLGASVAIDFAITYPFV